MTKMNDFYFREIEKIPLLTLEEEKTLATKAFSGDKEAQNKLVEANLRFVVKIANRYKHYMELEDLITEGNLGLMHAAEKFNPNNGNKFSTYAVWWIQAYIQKAIRETSTGIRFPAHKFKEMKNPKWNIASLDKTIDCDGDADVTLGAFLKDNRVQTPEEEFINSSSSSQIRKMINNLNANEQTVLTKRYGLDGKKPMSLSEIGTLMGYSKERIRQLELRAINHLKNISNNLDYAGLAA